MKSVWFWTRIQCFRFRSTCRSASSKRRARPCAVYISKECITDLNALPKFHFIMKWNKRFYTQEKKKERDFLLENRSVKLNETAPKIFISLSLIFKFHLYIQHKWTHGLFKCCSFYLSLILTNKYQIFYDKVMNDEKLERIYMANLKDVPPSALWLLLTIRDQGWTCVRMVILC